MGLFGLLCKICYLIGFRIVRMSLGWVKIWVFISLDRYVGCMKRVYIGNYVGEMVCRFIYKGVLMCMLYDLSWYSIVVWVSYGCG